MGTTDNTDGGGSKHVFDIRTMRRNTTVYDE